LTAYVDVIVRRWQDFTERSARHEASGQLFDERARSRTPITQERHMSRKAFVAGEPTREKVRHLAGLGVAQDEQGTQIALICFRRGDAFHRASVLLHCSCKFGGALL
jgi:hypothetical protein